MSVGERLKNERNRLGLAQKDMAERCAVSPRAQRMFESGENIPGGAYLIAAAALQVDIQYVLTGTTTALRSALNDLRSATEVAQAVGGSREQQLAVQEAEFHRLQAPRMSDLERLAAAIGAVEEGLAETRRKLPPDKRAELIFAAYQLMAEPQQSRDNVVRLVRTAA